MPSTGSTGAAIWKPSQRSKPRQAVQNAAGSTDKVLLALALVLVEVGWFHIRLGRLEEAEAALAESRAIHDKLDAPPSGIRH